MSVRMMSLVWELTLPDSEKLVLLALADCANDEGRCWPSMKTLSGKCSKSDRTIQGCIKSLCAKGHLSREEVPGKGCHYTVHPIVLLGGIDLRHYVYKTTRTDTGEYYIGARSCYADPDNDPYVGSGRWVQWQVSSGAPLQKSILAEYDSRESLAEAERDTISEHFGDPLCQNAKRGGLSPELPAERRLSGATRTTPPPEEISPTPEAASDKPSKNHKEPSNDDDPSVDDLQEAWNTVAAPRGAIPCKRLTPERRKKLAPILKRHPVEDLTEAIEAVARSTFLCGKNDRGYRASITFLCSPEHVEKLLEGSYG